MKRLSLSSSSLCALSFVFAPLAACADTPAQQPLRKYQAVSAPSVRPAPIIVPQSEGPQDLDALFKRLRNGIPAITGLTLETKNALLQLLARRQAILQTMLNNVNEELRIAHARMENHQAQWQDGNMPPEKRAQWLEESRGLLLASANAQMAALNAKISLNENDALTKRAQSIPVISSSIITPAVPSPALPSSRTLHYTPADAAALVKRHPLLTPEDQVKAGIKHLDGAGQDTTGKP